MTDTARAGSAVPGLAGVERLAPRRPGQTASSQVRDTLGTGIAGGVLGEGQVLTVDDVVVATGASRSVVREAMHVLTSMGLLLPRRHVGFRVEAQAQWNAVDPLVIRWRLSGPDQARTLTHLAELRLGLEPEAARLAALRIDPGGIDELIAAASDMSAHRNSPEAFFEADSRFHQIVLEASANPLFVHVVDVVREALRWRAVLEPVASEEDIQLHLALAREVQARAGEKAAQVMRNIVERSSPPQDAV